MQIALGAEGCRVDAPKPDYCALWGSLEVDDGVVFEFFRNLCGTDVCCSSFSDHKIKNYSNLLESACMDPCDRLKLCICQTSFQQPTAAGDSTTAGSDLAPFSDLDTMASGTEAPTNTDGSDSLPTGTSDTDSDPGLTESTDTEDLA